MAQAPFPFDPYDNLPQVPAFTVTSKDFKDGETLAKPYASRILGAGGEDLSPGLEWTGFPAETRSFAVTMYDPDAPTAAGYWHWATYDIPASVTSLATGAGTPGHAGAASLPETAITLPCDAGLRQYIGCAPPPGHGPHRYFFVVHAVDVESLGHDIPTPTVLGFNLFFHTLARARLVGRYEEP